MRDEQRVEGITDGIEDLVEELVDDLVEEIHVDPDELLHGDEPVVSSAVDILKGGGARIASDGAGPTVAFYVGFKLAGLGAGVGLAVLVAVIAAARARRQGRSGLLPWVTCAMVVIQGAIGLIAGDAKGFFAPQLITGGVWAVAFLGSVVVRRPLIGFFAKELFPMPDHVRESDGFLRLTSVLSIVFGVVTLARVGVRLVQLRGGSIDGYLLVNLLTGFPVTMVMIGWGLWYSRRTIARIEAASGRSLLA